jgi:anti-sigma regulatory factor (Ser/Thr protein kinase)
MLELQADALNLTSELADLLRVAPWLDELGERYGIAADARFAIELCLEEALSNVIRHGYGDEPGRPLRVTFEAGAGGGAGAVAELRFTIEDEAPAFNPLEQPVPPPLGPGDSFRVGGQGIRLLQRFAHRLEYARRERGNRLLMGFLNQAGPA